MTLKFKCMPKKEIEQNVHEYHPAKKEKAKLPYMHKELRGTELKFIVNYPN